MPRGRPPKPADQRARRNKPTFPQTEIAFRPCDAPELPTVTEDEYGNPVPIHWHRLTREWWDSWVNSAQAELFSHTDWRSLITTAFVAERFYRGGSTSAAAELRTREKAFGATPYDRLSLRMSYLDVDAAEDKAAERKARQGAQGVAPPATGRYAGLAVVPGD